MSVTVDDRPLPAEQMGLQTIGQLLSHIQKENRLIVHVLIDGEEPDLARLGSLKQAPLRGKTLYIETTEPKQMALEVLDAVESQLAEADRLTNDAVDLLRSNQTVRAPRSAAAREAVAGGASVARSSVGRRPIAIVRTLAMRIGISGSSRENAAV